MVNKTTHHSNLTSIGRVRTWQTGKKTRVTREKVAAANLAVVARVVDRKPVSARVVVVHPVDSAVAVAVAVVATADANLS